MGNSAEAAVLRNSFQMFICILITLILLLWCASNNSLCCFSRTAKQEFSHSPEQALQSYKKDDAGKVTRTGIVARDRMVNQEEKGQKKETGWEGDHGQKKDESQLPIFWNLGLLVEEHNMTEGSSFFRREE